VVQWRICAVFSKILARHGIEIQFNLTSELTRKKVSCTANRNGYHLIIDDVPAWVCQQCNEALFDEETMEAIQSMLREMDRQREQLTRIPVAT